MSSREVNSDGNDKSSDKHAGQRMDEKQMSVLVRGVFWFAWLTGKYRRAALMASKVESQRAELN